MLVVHARARVHVIGGKGWGRGMFVCVSLSVYACMSAYNVSIAIFSFGACVCETCRNHIESYCVCLKSLINIGNHSLITKLIKTRTIFRNQYIIMSIFNCNRTYGNKIPMEDSLIFSKRAENLDFLINRGFDWFYCSETNSFPSSPPAVMVGRLHVGVVPVVLFCV